MTQAKNPERFIYQNVRAFANGSKFVFLPIGWEKGFKGSRIQGFEWLSSRELTTGLWFFYPLNAVVCFHLSLNTDYQLLILSTYSLLRND